MPITRGNTAHYFRRAFHVLGIGVFPLFYYGGLLRFLSRETSNTILLILLVVILLFELVRLRKGWLLFGQREYEKDSICATTWTLVALIILLLLSPTIALSMAIAVTCAIVDPLLGELRSHQFSQSIVFVVGCLVAFIIWYLAGFSLWLSIVMSIVIVAVEKPNFKWIDDNALMILTPLVLYIAISLIRINLLG